MCINYLHLVEALLSALLRLVRNLRVVECSLQATCDIVGVLVSRVLLDVTAVKLIVEDLTGVLLGLFGGVSSYSQPAASTHLSTKLTRVVDVGLVATNDVSLVGHGEVLGLG